MYDFFSCIVFVYVCGFRICRPSWRRGYVVNWIESIRKSQLPTLRHILLNINKMSILHANFFWHRSSPTGRQGAEKEIRNDPNSYATMVYRGQTKVFVYSYYLRSMAFIKTCVTWYPPESLLVEKVNQSNQKANSYLLIYFGSVGFGLCYV